MVRRSRGISLCRAGSRQFCHFPRCGVLMATLSRLATSTKSSARRDRTKRAVTLPTRPRSRSCAARPSEELQDVLERGRWGVARQRLALQGIERRLATLAGEGPRSDDLLALIELAYLQNKSCDELLALQ